MNLDFNFSEIDWLFWSVALAITVLSILFYLLMYSSLIIKARKYKQVKLIQDNLPGVSVIICAKNELSRLQKNLNAILEQKYPNFELVIVDDASWDGTSKMLEQLEKRNSKVKVVTNTLNENGHGKKMALTLGIKAAKNEILLMTDADCEPVSDLWILNMVQPYLRNDKIAVVLGLSPVQKLKGLLNVLIRYDHLRTILSYAGWAAKGVPYMGVGRNLSYKKSLFFKNSGFKSHYMLQSGDDDLFVNEVANKNNTALVLHPDGFVITEPKESITAWFWQKKRHYTTSSRYHLRSKLALVLPYVINFIFLTSLILGLFKGLGTWMLLFFLLKNLIVALIFWRAAKYFNAGSGQFWSPLYYVFFLIFDPYCHYSNQYIKYQRWK